MNRFLPVFLILLLATGVASAQYGITEVDAPLNQVTLPSDFFTPSEFTADPDSVAPGYIYFDVEAWTFMPTFMNYGYTVIMDNEGNVRYFDRSADSSWTSNFAPFDDWGLIGYDIGGCLQSTQYVLVDTNFVPVDTISAPNIDNNGYRIDTHEFQIGPDGNYWIEAHYDSLMDMSQYFDGAATEFDVGAHAVMKLDRDTHEPLWVWKSLDHLDEISFRDSYDTTRWLSQTRTSGEHLHTNALQVDTDGNVLVSNRFTSTVTKVRVNPGQPDDGSVMWKLGGGPGNEFTFISDQPDSVFDTQHDVRRLPNGHITVYDNGTGRTDSSYAKEYAVDEVNKTAELVWSYHRPNMVSPYSMATGSNRRLPNGNTLICWGWGTDYSITEVTPSKNIAWEISFEPMDGVAGGYPLLYRAFKSEMLGTAATPYVVALCGDGQADLTMNWFGHTDVDSFFVEVANEADGIFTAVGGVDSARAVLTGLTNGEIYNVRIRAKTDDGSMSDWSRVWRFHLPIVDSVDERIVSLPGTFKMGTAYPNPFNPSTVIPVNINRAGKLEIRVYDVLGREVSVLHRGTISAGEHRFTFNAANQASGVYFVVARTADGVSQVRRVVLVR